MNSISWLIYGAETLYNMIVCLRVFLVLGGVGLIIFGGICIANYYDSLDNYHHGYGDKYKEKASLWFSRIPLKSLIACVFAFILSFAFPSPMTIYLIAASEIGSEIIKKPEVQGVYTDLLSLLQKKIQESLTEDGKK